MLRNSFDLREHSVYQVVHVVRPNERDYRVIGSLLENGYHAVAVKNGFQLERKLKEEIK